MNAPVKKKGRFKKPGVLRWTLAGIILATCIALVTVFIGYRRLDVKPEDNAAILSGTSADIALQEIRHTATRNGRDEWTLTAKSARFMGEPNKTVIENPTVVFFLSDGKEVRLTAKQGVLLNESNDLEAIGDVTVTSEAYVLKTERLRYDHKKQLLFAEMPIAIQGSTISLNADQMSYDLNTRMSTLTGRVEGTIHDNRSL